MAVRDAFKQDDYWPIASRGSERRHKQALALMLGYVGMGAGGAAYVLTDRGQRECAIPINGEPQFD